MFVDIEFLNGDLDCSSVDKPVPVPAAYMVDGKPLCEFCLRAMLPVAEIVG